ncbi:glycoside hydrolase family 15 protein [Pontibacter akesuensis]|uniref:Glucoamylase (Glucan-1,4-alpha-glucosidase), GH15 family n=1 Tax=Pontibacter akesuensis TaxID=388950 RepID=A0A1I7I6S7_9BACT|nr:glycoside hydrolase family 15 protein [Pontibacter akesuensis]GHA65504.1 glucoamylase [Pontibacter akesuensis]SFU68655.1 Glucoamylase (glucan-1,4-alpha-glucosidase), GH15 family [Pontibacter akesuensis]
MDYQPIENYAVIGDLNTVALVGLNGTIDFMCFPDFDSPSIFAAILDNEKGGSFSIQPTADGAKHRQLYLPDTNVLLTRFLHDEGIGEITDFMPVEALFQGKELIRRVSCVHGDLTFTMRCAPRFNYARSPHTVQQKTANEVIFKSEGSDNTTIRLKSSTPIHLEDGDAVATFTLKTGETADFLLDYITCDTPPATALDGFVTETLYATINYWKDWVATCNYKGRWMEVVHRSALVLKLMTSHKYGSIVAAPTFGLPEQIGGMRNWDYRYTWIRDASFTVYALLRLGFRKEAKGFVDWVDKQCDDIGDAGHLSLMYSIDGRKELTEIELNHLEGYMGSKPVRIGNGAYDQIQLDIYGELLDSVYLYDKYGEPISFEFWDDLRQQVEWVCDNWRREDEGIWEVRGGKKQFLYSRMMCWVAIDRAMKIAEKHSYPLPERWRKERDKIFFSIHHDFWNEELQSFVQYKGADTVDAATLLMPLIRFIGPKDPRWLSTLKRIEEKLVSDALVFRYRVNEELDGLQGGEGTFSMCTFWYVECLARAGQVDKARLYFEKMLGYANHVGLYAEMLGLKGEHLGNFPQAFTHLGLISAALSINDILEGDQNKKKI